MGLLLVGASQEPGCIFVIFRVEISKQKNRTEYWFTSYLQLTIAFVNYYQTPFTKVQIWFILW